MQRIPILVFVFFCFTSVISAQSIAESDFINFNQSSGLPSNEAYYILKDSKQQLWISTDQGVVKFNGKNFEKIELPDKVVFKIKEDRKGRIWFFTQSGKLYNYNHNKVETYLFNDTIIKYIDKILTIDALIDDKQNIHINSSNFGFNYSLNQNGKIFIKNPNINIKDNYIQFNVDKIDDKLLSYSTTIIKDDKQFIRFKFNGVLNDSIYTLPLNDKVANHYSVIQLKNGTVYFFWANILYLFKKNGICSYKKFDKNIISINADKDENVYVGFFKGGLRLINDNLNEKVHLFKTKSVSSIEFDNEKGMWISTLENGVFYKRGSIITPLFKDVKATFLRTYNYKDSLLYFANSDGIFEIGPNYLRSVFKQSFTGVYDFFIFEKCIFLSCNYKTDIYCKFKPIKHNQVVNRVLLTPSVYEIGRSNNNQFVISFYKSIMFYKFQKENTINNIRKSSNFIGYDLFPIIGNIYVDSTNNILLASKSGLYKFDTIKNKIFNLKESNILFENGTSSIRNLNKDLIIVGLRFNGLAIMNNDSVINYINEQNGLINNSVKSIFVDKNNCWVSTANGLSVIKFSSYNPLKYTIINLGKSKGINNLLIYQINKFKNDILLTTNEGIQQIKNADSILNLPKDSLPFSIASIKYFGGDTSLINSLQAPYNKNSIAFTLNAICYNAADEVAYYYKINDVDTIWNKINTNELVLENLAPGIYDISFKAEVKSDNRYSEIIHFKFTVNKPWWDLTIVKIIGLLLLVLFISLFYRIRLFRIRKKDKEKAALKLKMSELEQTALRSQINPHFIFNCLTSIQHLIILNNSREANDYLVKFARLIRATLDISSKPTVVLKTEIDYLNDYVSLENLRTLTKVNLKFSIDPLINQNTFEFPSMILQPLIENAIRHGFNESVSDGTIEIKIFIKKNYIECQVQDDGVGYDISKINQRHKSFAMQNIIQRIRTLSNVGQPKVDDVLEIINLSTLNSNLRGTLVTLIIPLLNQTSTI